MGKNKLQRFAENETFTNLFQHNEFEAREGLFPLKGKWHTEYFKNEHPIVLELGCGKGEYTIGMSQRYSDKNFIGIDRKGARLWRGCKDAYEQKISNVAFLRIKIEDIEHYFAPGEVSEIWVTFPDPQLRKERKRLVGPNMVGKYKKILSEDGILHLKTDSRELYDYLKETAPAQVWEILEDVYDVYQERPGTILTEITTFYETMWLKEGKVISYLKIRVKR